MTRLHRRPDSIPSPHSETSRSRGAPRKERSMLHESKKRLTRTLIVLYIYVTFAIVRWFYG